MKTEIEEVKERERQIETGQVEVKVARMGREKLDGGEEEPKEPPCQDGVLTIEVCPFSHKGSHGKDFEQCEH